MTSVSQSLNFERYIPLVGNINDKSPFAYQATRSVVAVFNAIQMGVAESYINGLEVPDSAMKGLFDACMPILFRYFPSLLVPYDWVLQETDNLAEGARDLMKIQYDLPQTMLNTMLGDSKLIYPKYSMGLWEKGAANLEQAQKQMLDDLIAKADIQDGDEILDLGCGWGCAANYILSQFPNATVTGLNLSREQCNYIRQKMIDSQSYLSFGRFTLCEQDFNEVNFEKKFDKIITVGFFEHVGNLTRAFQKLASFLKDNGKVFIHIITVRTPNNISIAFLHKYIFPNGRIWNYDAIPSRNQDLKTIQKWYLNGHNYAKTLESWLKNFDDNQEKIKTLNYGMNYEKFRRIWRLYLLLCIACFENCDGEILGNTQCLMVRA